MSGSYDRWLDRAVRYCDAVEVSADRPLREALWSKMVFAYHDYFCSDEYLPPRDETLEPSNPLFGDPDDLGPEPVPAPAADDPPAMEI